MRDCRATRWCSMLTRSRSATVRAMPRPTATGYVAKLAQSETNVAGLRVSVEARNRTISAMSAADAARLAQMGRQVAAAQAAARKDQDKLAVFMATPPSGADVCTRAKDIDGRVVELLK